MNEELMNSIYKAARIATEEQAILDEEYFNEWEFQLFMLPNGTIRLLRESEYFRELPEGWEQITYDNHDNWELTEASTLQVIVEDWLNEKNQK